MSTIALADAQPTTTGRTLRPETVAVSVAYAGALLPIVAAVIRALAEHWIPLGDNAYFLVRSRDVLTEHHPLLGAWSSGSQSVDVSVNNLGSLQLDLLAPFTKIGPAAGTVIGVGLTNALAVIGVGWIARRLGGALVATIALAGAASVTWSMGSAMLVEPRQHPAMVLPFLCYLVAVWAVAAGRAWALPVAVFAGSLVLQTHLSYALLVPLLAVWGLAGFAWRGRNARRDGEWDEWWTSVRRSTLIAALVALACWAQPLIDQFWGEHNLRRVLGASGEGSAPGLGDASRMVADVVGLPPFWGRSSFGDYAPGADLPGVGLTALALVALVAVLAAGAVRSHRAGQPIGVVGVATAAVAVAGAVVSAARLPVGVFGLVAANYRWLWAIGPFCAVAAIVALWPTGARAETRGLAGFAAVAVLLGLAAVPASYQSDEITQDAHRMAAGRDLLAQLAPLADRDVGPVLIDRSNSPFGEPFTYAVIGELQSLGIDFRFTHPRDGYRYGDDRRPRGDERSRLTFAYGDDASVVPVGAERVAMTSGIDADEQVELNTLHERITGALADGSMAIDLGAAQARVGRELPALQQAVAGQPVLPSSLYFELSAVEQHDVVASGPDLDADVSRFLDLGDRHLFGSVAVYLTPIS